MQMLAFVKQFRNFGEDFFDLFGDVGEYEANRLKENNGAWKKASDLKGEFGGAGEFIKLVALWGEMNL